MATLWNSEGDRFGRKGILFVSSPVLEDAGLLPQTDGPLLCRVLSQYVFSVLDRVSIACSLKLMPLALVQVMGVSRTIFDGFFWAKLVEILSQIRFWLPNLSSLVVDNLIMDELIARTRCHPNLWPCFVLHGAFLEQVVVSLTRRGQAGIC